MLEIRIAKENEYELVKAFYHSLIDAMQDAEYKPGWEKLGVHPDFSKKGMAKEMVAKVISLARQQAQKSSSIKRAMCFHIAIFVVTPLELLTLLAVTLYGKIINCNVKGQQFK